MQQATDEGFGWIDVLPGGGSFVYLRSEQFGAARDGNRVFPEFVAAEMRRCDKLPRRLGGVERLKNTHRKHRAANRFKPQQDDGPLDTVHVPAHARVRAMNELENARGERDIARNEFHDFRRAALIVRGDLQHANRDGGQRRKILQLLEDQLDALFS